MAKDASEKDQSMEEILQSIKRIIAEEGDDAAAPDANEEREHDIPGSAILNLEELNEDENVLDLTDEVEASSADKSENSDANDLAPPADVMPNDVLADIDSLLSDETMRASAAALKALSDAQAPARGARDVSRHAIGFRSGTTVEDLVVEALRPMLKEWFDTHLPGIVRELVAKEIKKLTH